MKYTYNIVKSGFKFTIHSRDYSEEDGDPTTDNPTVEFEVLDDKDYADAEDFFGAMEEITTLADNFDLVANAITYITHHPIENHNESDPNLVDLIDTAIDMTVNWNLFEVSDDYKIALQQLSERLHSFE
jgi:hypothetical protein